MAKEVRNVYVIKKDGLGQVQIAEEVVCAIAALAALEVEGVVSMVGTTADELANMVGFKNLSKGVRIQLTEGVVGIDLAIVVGFGYPIPKVAALVQDRVKSSVENMTGLEVSNVNIRIASAQAAKKAK